LLLLRHGQTQLSVDKLFSGIGDPVLTEVGLAQAALAANRLAGSKATAVISSPLSRARQTAEAVAGQLGLEVEVEEGFRETDFGDWEGYSFSDIRKKWPRELEAWLADSAVAPPFGESFDATTTRVRQARDRVLAKHGGETVVVVSHVSPIKTLLRLALDAPHQAMYRMHLDLACLSEVQWFSDGPAVVRSLNDTHHLASLA
jgi:broad specificity phosphatase PhoE